MMKWLIGTICFLALSNLHAAAATDLGAHLNALHSMRANFTQTIYDSKGRAIQKSFGNMALQRPGKFRWEISRPIPQLIIANATRLWIYDPDLQQVTIRALHQATGETPALLLSHENATIDKDYIVTELPNSRPDAQWFLLQPRGADSAFASVKMGFKKQQLTDMRLEDRLGHTTAVQFQQAQTNVSLSASLFEYKPKKNVDVIDETKRQ